MGKIYFPELFKDKITGRIVSPSPIHSEWSQIYRTQRRVVIEAPRHHAKTTRISKLCCLWDLLENKINVLLTSKNPGLSKKTHRWIKRQILNNRLLINDYQIQVEIANERELVFYVGGEEVELLSIPSGSEFVGFRAGRIICDDILNNENCYTAEQRKKLKDWYFNDLINILGPEDGIILIGTPRHNDDLLQGLKKNKAYFCKTYKSIDGDNVLWSDMWSREKLEARKAEIGSYAFNQNYQCVVYDNEMSAFPMVYLNQCKLAGLSFQFSRNGERAIYMGCDFAVQSDKQKAKERDSDYNAFITVGIEDDGKRRILNIHRERGNSFDYNINKMLELIQAYRPNRITVENNVFQDLYFQELIKHYPNIYPHSTGRDKLDLYNGVPSLSGIFENKRIELPYESEADREIIDQLILELNAFGYEKHDDLVMALWLCELGIRTAPIQRPILISRNEKRSLSDGNFKSIIQTARTARN